MKTVENNPLLEHPADAITIKKVALVGGPCSGKTTMLERLAKNPELQNRFLVVPEAATLLLPGFLAVKAESVGPEHPWQKHLQRAIIATQLGLEATYAAHAAKNNIPLLVCDRGLLDAGVYTSDGLGILEHEFGITPQGASDNYAGVIHLESLAVTAPHLYSKSNNKTRYETLEEAREVEARTLVAWEGHPNRLVLTGSELEDKHTKAAAFIIETLGSA